MKKIKIKKKFTEKELVIYLQNWILKTTNAGLISLELNRHCWKFITELQKIPLSEELQRVKK